MKIEFPLPDKIWSTNQDRNYSPHTRHRLIQNWKETTGWAWKASGIRKTFCVGGQHNLCCHLSPKIVHVKIPVKDSRRRDPHNYCGTVVKAVIDGLVNVGVWPDDTPEYVGHREPELYKGELVVVELWPK